jgi:CDP-diacylglycerol--glycerol-3-phosphate 3-phosphatidyltransferase
VFDPATSEKIKKKIPNVLTIMRILVVPVFVYLLSNPTPKSSLWATIIFVVASIKDWFDGFLARVYKAQSILGTILDPLADKILVTAALVMLCAVPEHARVPAWIVVAILSREVIVTGLRSLAALKGQVVPASTAAKHKTAWTMVAIVALLIHEKYTIFGYVFNFHLIGIYLIWIALFLTIYSGITYAIALRDVFEE